MKIKKFKENKKFNFKYAILLNEKYLIQEVSDNPNSDIRPPRFNEHDLESVLDFYEKIFILHRNENYRIVKVFVESVDDEVEMIKNAKKYNL